MTKKLLFFWVALLCPYLSLYAQSTKPKLITQIYKKDTAFSCIAVDSAGVVYASSTFSQGLGLWRFKENRWTDFNGVFGKPAFVRSRIRQLLAVGTRVWVANSGYVVYLGSGEAGNNMNFFGGVFSIAKSNPASRKYYKGRPVLGQMPNAGPPTRNILGVWVDSTGTAWAAGSYQDSLTYPAFINYNPRYHYAPGAIGRNPNPGPVISNDNFSFISNGMPAPDIQIGVGISYKTESWSIGKRRTIRCITQVGNEMWAGSDGYTAVGGSVFTAGILRYDLQGNYLGKWEESNTGIPFGTSNVSQGPWAIHKDGKNRVWINLMGGGGTAVYENGVWQYIGTPPGTVANNSVFQAHAIASGKNGEVYFGTSNGLVMYKGKGAYTSDTSYYTYTTADGLPSNAIRDIGVDKNSGSTIWLATAAGIARIAMGDLYVFNQKPMSSSLLNVTDNDRFRVQIAAYYSQNTQEAIDKDTLFIAADGSRATIFKWEGSDPNNIKFRIKEDPNGQNTDEYGYFVLRYRTSGNDSIRVQYYHPKFIDELYTVSTQFNGRMATLELVDTTVTPEKVVLSKKIKFVLPPVLMLHGLWSDGETTWTEMKKYLGKDNGLYNYRDYQLLSPSYPNDRHFESNMWYVKSYIDDLLQNCRDNKLSAGKVDLVVHSMGGILSRLYLQNTAQGYSKDINKLITLNTPHSGSPLSNIVTEKDDVFKWIMSKTGHNPNNGALGDLAIGKAPIDNLLNGQRLNANKVPSFTIRTVDQLPEWLVFADEKIVDWVKKPIKLKPQPYFNVVPGRGGGVKGMIAKQAAKAIYVGVKYYLTKHTSCSWDDNLNVCMQRIFGGNSDLIVSEPSQRAGLTTGTELFNNVNHLNVHSVIPVKSKVLSLLRANSESQIFAKDGFAPPKFRWDPNAGTVAGRSVNSETLSIVTPVTGAAYNRNDSVSVTIRTSPGIKRMLMVMSYENDIDAFAIENPDSIFGFRVPADAMSRIYYKVIGFDDARNTYEDSSYITIGQQAGLTVDSIIADRYDEVISVRQGDSTNLTIWGYFSDGVTRNISYEPGLSYGFGLTGIAGITGNSMLKGLQVGTDVLIIGYENKRDTVLIEVLPRISTTPPIVVLPVTFNDIHASYKNGYVAVNWSTSFEYNNKEFEVQHSRDGSVFETFAKVSGNLYSQTLNTYNSNHYQYVIGRNYYRVKQIDADGYFSYSKVAMVSVNEKTKVYLYPNPVQDELTITIGHEINAAGIRIINNTGQVVHTAVLPAGRQTLQINVANFNRGLYYVELIDNSKTRIWNGTFVK